MGMEPNVKASRKSIVGDILKGALKGTLISMVFTVAVILLFALIIKETGLSDSVIAPVNQVLKILGIIGAAWFAIKGMMEKQWLTGGIAGLLFISLSYLVFSLIEGIFGNVALLFSDMLMGLLIGMVFSIIVANFGKSSRTRVKTQKSKRIQFKKARV
jgi:putative membrane protein (TIGR04086 family)